MQSTLRAVPAKGVRPLFEDRKFVPHYKVAAQTIYSEVFLRLAIIRHREGMCLRKDQKDLKDVKDRKVAGRWIGGRCGLVKRLPVGFGKLGVAKWYTLVPRSVRE